MLINHARKSIRLRPIDLSSPSMFSTIMIIANPMENLTQPAKPSTSLFPQNTFQANHVIHLYYLKVSNNLELLLLRLAEIPLHRQRRPRPFLDRAVDETAPADCPVAIGEEHVALARAEVLEGGGDEAGGGEEPCAFGELVVGPVVEDLFGFVC